MPLNRDGSRHPWECRVTISNVKTKETGRAPLVPCSYCEDDVKYGQMDLKMHIQARHPIARTLPRGT